MNQKEFVKYWRDKDYSQQVLKYDKKTLIKIIKYILNLKEDFRKLNFEEKEKIVYELFGDFKKYYKKILDKEIENSIKIGKQRVNGL
mgnify:CR=1 FL=1